MESTVKAKDGKILKVITQQYQIGLYVAIYDGNTCIDQFGLNVTEQEFHNSLKGKVKKI